METTPEGRQDARLQENRSEDAHVRALSNRAQLAFAVVCACLLVALAAAWMLPRSVDEQVLALSRTQIANALESQGESLGQLGLEYSYWNEAIERIIHRQDEAWANRAVGNHLHSTYDISNVLAVDRDGEPRYEFRDGPPRERTIWDASGPVLERLSREVLAGESPAPDQAYSYAMVDGRVYLVAATPFVPYEPTSLDTTVFHGVMFLARPINEATMEKWSTQYALEGLRVVPADTNADQPSPSDGAAATVPLTDLTGQAVARIAWEPHRYGQAALARVLPWGFSLAVIFVVAATLLVVHLRKLVFSARGSLAALDQQRQKFFRQAMFDEVSGLHNRNYLISRLEEELSRIRRACTSSIFIFLDLDGFKVVNDTMGHSAGDELLRQVGERLVSGVRSEDVVCRFGGDEFCILITDLQGRQTSEIRGMAEKISRQIIEGLERPFTVDDKPVNIGASAGIVIIPDDTANIEDILRFGDLAMYKAKRESGNTFIYYEQEFLHDINYRNAVRYKLESAVPKKEFGLHYQPIHDAGSGEVVGFEALARWDSEELGLIRPSQFIAIAEESDTIVRLGRWVIDEALSRVCSLREIAGGRAWIAINVSEKQLADPEFCDYLQERMDLYGVDPGDVYLELTETYQFGRTMDRLDVLRDIRERGVQLSLDNFGTGYASLSYLQQYPLSAVKIDREFVKNVLDDDKVAGIVRAIVQMADALGIRVIAEGVETFDQEQELVRLGCHWIQGFRYSKPKPLETLMQVGVSEDVGD